MIIIIIILTIILTVIIINITSIIIISIIIRSKQCNTQRHVIVFDMTSQIHSLLTNTATLLVTLPHSPPFFMVGFLTPRSLSRITLPVVTLPHAAKRINNPEFSAVTLAGVTLLVVSSWRNAYELNSFSLGSR